MFIVTATLWKFCSCGGLYHTLLQSLEDELVREAILQLVSLKLWHTLSFGRLQVSLGFSALRMFPFSVFGFLSPFKPCTDGTVL
jgi:hypothetical protein